MNPQKHVKANSGEISEAKRWLCAGMPNPKKEQGRFLQTMARFAIWTVKITKIMAIGVVRQKYGENIDAFFWN